MSYVVPGLPEPEEPDVPEVLTVRTPGVAPLEDEGKTDLLGEPFHVLFTRALKRHGLTKGEAARHLGLPRGRITDWANGRREPGASRALWLIFNLGMNLEEFLPE